jgi:probable HAF family extracellular repeat protein
VTPAVHDRIARTSITGIRIARIRWLTAATISVGLVLGAAAVPASAAATQRPYRTVDLGTLGGPNSAATAGSAAGWVVGTSDVPAGGTHAFRWRGGRMTDLGTLGGPDSTASDVDARGRVVGVSTTTDGTQHGFLWTHGRMTDLTPDRAYGTATAVDDAGTVAGTLSTATTLQAYTWRAGEVTLLAGAADAARPDTTASDIAAGGDVIGIGNTGHDLLRWHSGSATLLVRTSGTFAGARINRSGDIVGSVSVSHVSHAYLWHDGTYQSFDPLPDSAGCTADAVDDRGRFAGACFARSAATWHPYLASGADSAVDLTTRGVPVRTTLVGLDDRGRLTGTLLGDVEHAAVFLPGRARLP